jgi:hypothetical protein
LFLPPFWAFSLQMDFPFLLVVSTSILSYPMLLTKQGCCAGHSKAVVRRPRSRCVELWGDLVRHAVWCLALRWWEHLKPLPQNHCMNSVLVMCFIVVFLALQRAQPW